MDMSLYIVGAFVVLSALVLGRPLSSSRRL
jgi:hypothetical protein